MKYARPRVAARAGQDSSCALGAQVRLRTFDVRVDWPDLHRLSTDKPHPAKVDESCWGVSTLQQLPRRCNPVSPQYAGLSRVVTSSWLALVVSSAGCTDPRVNINLDSDGLELEGSTGPQVEQTDSESRASRGESGDSEQGLDSASGTVDDNDATGDGLESTTAVGSTSDTSSAGATGTSADSSASATDSSTGADSNDASTTSGAGTQGGTGDESTSAGQESSTAGGESGSDATGDVEHNECGGTTVLPAEVGTPCHDCDDKSWQCSGTEALVCSGFDSDAVRLWPDSDGDGFGAAGSDAFETCNPPATGYAKNASDCDDDNAEVFPGQVETCNAVDDDCDTKVDEGHNANACDDACCSAQLRCEAGACVQKCAGAVVCGEQGELCCEAGEMCFAHACVTPSGDCNFTEDCDTDEVCAEGLGQCVTKDVLPDCQFIPPVGEFEPVLGCRWEVGIDTVNPHHKDVVATPVIINLTDDDGDGRTDRNDIPDIAFLTYDYGDSCCNTDATLRIVSGECTEVGTMVVKANIDTPQLAHDTGIASADLNLDGVPELVAMTRLDGYPQGLVAFERVTSDGSEWRVLWEQPDYPKWDVHTRGGATIGVYDVDANGTPEVVVGNVVLAGATGELVWDGRVTSGGTGGVGNNGFMGPSSTVADIDLDGKAEILAGHTVYEHDGSVKWSFSYTTSNSRCGGSIPCDGFNAVANFDDDDRGEVVIVRLGEVFVLDDDGTELHRVQLPVDDCSRNESGPPTIADFDGDGYPEIGTASADYYVVVDLQCTGPGEPDAWCESAQIGWKVANNDCSSRVTASSVFDFEGDGRAEVVYADETSFRIFDGRSGAVLFSDDTFGSHTRLEMPAIADVDNDGNAEVVIPENSSNGGTPGLEVWRDKRDHWVRTRRVWNQHGYSITHVTEDGAVPANPEVNWLNARFNNFRQNVQPDGLFDAADATVSDLSCGFSSAMGSDDALDLSIVIRNGGAATFKKGSLVELTFDKDGVQSPFMTTLTTKDLYPGSFELLHIVQPMLASYPEAPFVVKVAVDADASVNECREDNNVAEVDCIPPGAPVWRF